VINLHGVQLGGVGRDESEVDGGIVSAKKIEESPRAANLSPEQKQQQIEVGAKITPYILYASGLLIPILFAVIVGAVMLGAFNLLGGANTISPRQ